MQRIGCCCGCVIDTHFVQYFIIKVIGSSRHFLQAAAVALLLTNRLQLQPWEIDKAHPFWDRVTAWCDNGKNAIVGKVAFDTLHLSIAGKMETLSEGGGW
jgi:hypothetical protein